MANENSFAGQFWKMFFGVLTTILTTALLIYFGLQKKPESDLPRPLPYPIPPVVQLSEKPLITLAGIWYNEANIATVLTEDNNQVTLSTKVVQDGLTVELTGTGTRYRDTVPMILSLSMAGLTAFTCPGKLILEDDKHAILTYQFNGISTSASLRRL